MHNRTCNLDYVSNNLQLSTIDEGLKSFRRELGEATEVSQERVMVRTYKPKYSILSTNCRSYKL